MDQTYLKSAALLPASKNILRPRPQGDGMDSETLKRQSTLSPSYIQQKNRHQNLATSPKTTTFSKSPKAHFVPHEPVKGAVRPLSNQVGNRPTPQPNKNLIEDTSTSKKTSDSFPFKHGEISARAETTNVTSNKFALPGKNTTKTIKVPVYNAPGHLSHKTYLTMQKKQQMSSNLNNAKICPNVQQSKDSVEIVIDGSGRVSESVAVDMESDLREVEGDTRTASMADLENLNDEINELRRELENQTKVNADLKKLLVASMGDDLHYKVDRLVQDKAQLTEEVGHYNKKIHQDYEDIDKLSIQADLWRSKFKASKVMSEELLKENSSLRQHFQSSHLALQRLLQERQQIKEWLSQTHRLLYKVKHAFDPRYAPKQTRSGPQTLLSLSQANLQLADNVKFRLLGPHVMLEEDGVDSSTVDALSPAEAYAFQVLSTPAPHNHLTAGVQQPVDQSVTTTTTTTTPMPYTLDTAHSRFHPHTNFDNLTLDVCPKCKGEIQVV